MATHGAAPAGEVVIVDGCGANLASLKFALLRLGAQPVVSRDFQRIAAADRVILPGVGAAGDAMARLEEFGLAGRLGALTRPVLGICMGMQLLFDGSAEDEVDCLGIIPGRLSALTPDPARPVPHMGWNRLHTDGTEGSPLLRGLAPGKHCYFVHSYAAPLSQATGAWTEYGDRFTSVVRWQNFHGVQFHPERSGPVGAQILKNFLELPA